MGPLGTPRPPLWLLLLFLAGGRSLCAFPRWWLARAILMPPLSWLQIDLEDPPELLVWGVRLWGGVFSALILRTIVFGHP